MKKIFGAILALSAIGAVNAQSTPHNYDGVGSMWSKNLMIGIGTDAPFAPLTIKTAADSPLSFQTTDNTWLYTQYFDKDLQRRAWMGLDQDLSRYVLNLENGTDKFIIPNGRIGVGTYSPVSTLTIGAQSTKSRESKGITLGALNGTIEYVHSEWENGFGSKIYSVDQGSGKNRITHCYTW